MTDRKTHCLDDLRMRILTQEIAPGSDLDEATLCERYGMSRTPMREILQRLGGEGYVDLTQNRGAKVTSMDLPVLRTFFQTAPMIYANVARLAAENRKPAQIAPLKAIQDAFRRATGEGDAAEAALHNHRFHLCLGEMAQNPYLLPSLKRMLIDHTRLSQTFYRPASADERDRVVRASAHHDEMIDAVERQEPERMVELTIEHWNLSRDRLERFVSPDPLPIDVLPAKDRTDAL